MLLTATPKKSSAWIIKKKQNQKKNVDRNCHWISQFKSSSNRVLRWHKVIWPRVCLFLLFCEPGVLLSASHPVTAAINSMAELLVKARAVGVEETKGFRRNLWAKALLKQDKHQSLSFNVYLGVVVGVGGWSACNVHMSLLNKGLGLHFMLTTWCFHSFSMWHLSHLSLQWCQTLQGYRDGPCLLGANHLTVYIYTVHPL